MEKVFKHLEEIRRNDHHDTLAHVLQSPETKAHTLKWPSASETEGCELQPPSEDPVLVCPCNKAAQQLMHTITSKN